MQLFAILTVWLLSTAPKAPSPASQSAGFEAAGEIQLVGNNVFSASPLRSVVANIKCDPQHAVDTAITDLPRGRSIADCRSLEDLAQTIEAFYLSRGYVLARASPSRDQSTGRPTVTITEGDLFHLGKIELAETGRAPPHDPLGDPAALKATLGLAPGDPFERQAIVEGLRKLRQRYDAAGYPQVLVTPFTDIHPAEHRVDLSIEIERGGIAPRANDYVP